MMNRTLNQEWRPASNNNEAFMDEAKRIRGDKGVGLEHENYNKINSPGEKALQELEKK